jgi:hypothetical protein
MARPPGTARLLLTGDVMLGEAQARESILVPWKTCQLIWGKF